MIHIFDKQSAFVKCLHVLGLNIVELEFFYHFYVQSVSGATSSVSFLG